MSDKPPGRRGRPRLSETDLRILEATRALIHDQGPQAVSVASVSERSGVARTTIYRRYDDRSALLRAALEPVAARGESPAHLDVAGRLEWVLAQAEDVLLVHVGPGGVAAVLTGGDPEFSQALRASLEQGLAPVVRQIEKDLETGALVATVSPQLVLNLVLGSCLAELLLRGAPDAGWRRGTAEGLASLLAGR